MCTVLIIVMRAPPSFQSCCVKIIKSLDVIVAHHSSKVEILPLEASNHTYIMYVHCVYTHSTIKISLVYKRIFPKKCLCTNSRITVPILRSMTDMMALWNKKREIALLFTSIIGSTSSTIIYCQYNIRKETLTLLVVLLL